jgi:hypothetical protein
MHVLSGQVICYVIQSSCRVVLYVLYFQVKLSCTFYSLVIMYALYNRFTVSSGLDWHSSKEGGSGKVVYDYTTLLLNREYSCCLNVLSSEMDPAEIRLIR